MLLVQQVTSNPLQRQTLILPGGDSVSITMYFRSLQKGWFLNELVYNTTFTIQGVRIVNSPNLLHQWRNFIPFGLACFSTAEREPSLIQDFSSGASKLYILTADEVAEYAEYLRA